VNTARDQHEYAQQYTVKCILLCFIIFEDRNDSVYLTVYPPCKELS